MLSSFKSAMEKPTIFLPTSHTQPFPLLVKYSSQSASDTTEGFERTFSFTELRTNWICGISAAVASLKIGFLKIKSDSK